MSNPFESLDKVQEFVRVQSEQEAQVTDGLMLSGKKILEMGLVQGLLDAKHQVQPAGIDFTLKQMASLESQGVIDFDNSKRILPAYQPIEFSRDDAINLQRGAYLVEFNETVTLPNNILGIMRTRSSVFRSGVTLTAGVIDPGYTGAIGSLLQVWNPHGISLTRNAKLVQWVFAQVENPSGKAYQGVYQGDSTMF